MNKYCLSLRKYLAFLESHSYSDSLPFSSMVVAEYLTDLHLEGSTKGAIDSALAALKWVHSFVPGINKSNNPMMDEFLSKIASGIRRDLGKPKNQKEPLTGGMVRQVIDSSDMEDLVDLRNCLVISFAYNLLLRHDEFSHVSLAHITEEENGYKILIPKSKTDKYRNGKHVFLARNSDLHSTSGLLKLYLTKTNLALGMNHFLFCPLKRHNDTWTTANSILSYSSFRDIIKKSVLKIGLNPDNFSTHSCRAGGATDLAPHVTEHELLTTGRWADSRSIRSYVDLKDEHRYEINRILQGKIDVNNEKGNLDAPAV